MTMIILAGLSTPTGAAHLPRSFTNYHVKPLPSRRIRIPIPSGALGLIEVLLLHHIQRVPGSHHLRRCILQHQQRQSAHQPKQLVGHQSGAALRLQAASSCQLLHHIRGSQVLHRLRLGVVTPRPIAHLHFQAQVQRQDRQGA